MCTIIVSARERVVWAGALSVCFASARTPVHRSCRMVPPDYHWVLRRTAGHPRTSAQMVATCSSLWGASGPVEPFSWAGTCGGSGGRQVGAIHIRMSGWGLL